MAPTQETLTGNAVYWTPPVRDARTNLHAIDEGFTGNVRPRSSDDLWEVVTDAFTHDIVRSYADKLKGEARASHVRVLMDGVIAYRMRVYGSTRERVTKRDTSLVQRLEVVLEVLEMTEQDDLDHFNDLLNG